MAILLPTRRTMTAGRIRDASTIGRNVLTAATAAAIRAAIELRDSATLAVGTTAGTVAAGDDSRFTNARTPTSHAASHAANGSDPLTLSQSQVTGLVDALGLKADLVNGILVTSQLPSLAIVEFLGSVASQSAMLALSGQRGDWCIRTDQGRVYVLTADSPSVLTSWKSLEYPASPVTTVNGQVGTVVLGPADVGAAAASHSHPAIQISDSTTIGRLILTATDAGAVRTGIGLGTAATRDVGTASGSVCAGDDSRLSDARTPTTHNQPASTISDSTAAGRALLTAADAAAQRSALGLGTAATVNTGTSSGNVPVLDGSGKLSASVIPAGSGSSITASTATDLTGFLRGNGSVVSGGAFALSDLPAGTLDFQVPQFVNSGWSFQFIDQTNYVVNPRFRIQQQPATTITNGAYAFDEWSLLCDPSQSWQALVTATGGTTVFNQTSTAGRILRVGQLNNDRMGLVQVVPNETTRALAGRTVRLTCRARFDSGFGASTQNVVLTLLAWTGTANAAGARAVTTNLNPWTWASTNHSVVATQTLPVSGNSSTVLSVSGLVPDAATNLIMVLSIQSPTANWSANGLLVSQFHLCNSSSRQLWQEPLPSVEEMQCYRRFYRMRGSPVAVLNPATKLSSSDAMLWVTLPVPMAADPQVTLSNAAHVRVYGFGYVAATGLTFQGTRFNSLASGGGMYFTCSGDIAWWDLNPGVTSFIDFSARL